MHYSNGRKAEVNDLVRGRGYNLKHEFTGVLVAANPGATTCNCTIATTVPQPHGTRVIIPGITESFGIFLEYGQLDAFVAIDSKTGEVLPPQA